MLSWCVCNGVGRNYYYGHLYGYEYECRKSYINSSELFKRPSPSFLEATIRIMHGSHLLEVVEIK